MKKLLSFCCTAALALGCINPISDFIGGDVEYPESTNTTSVVIVSIEDSYAGDNPGAEQDVQTMCSMLTNVTDDIVILRNGRATRKNIKNSILRACSNELAIIYFTCHGGWEKSKDSFETDGYDEFVYLSDTTMTDNELWECFKTSTNRVFTIFDCCNSGTMFRVGSSNEVKKTAFTASLIKAEDEKYDFTLLSWGACRDGYAAGATRKGGLFTTSIKNTYNAFGADVTYDTAWTILRFASDVSKYQKPDKHCLGDYSRFKNKAIFR